MMRASGLQLRPIPYPYRGMLAVCSDLDETPDRDVYLQTMRYLNTRHSSSMGPGAGLEVGNTIYFDMPADQFSYWNTDDAGRDMIHRLIRSGHIDCLHSYGDHATTRAHAARALDHLARHDCKLEVWIDHSVAPSNFGADIMRGQGDVPGSPVYHADLTCDFGVRYVWRGRVTSITGQEVPARLRGIFTPRRPLVSARTLAKEAGKRLRARRGHSKYALHGPNRVMQPSSLRDGRPVYEFLRCNPHPAGVSVGDTAAGLAEVLTDAFLSRLVHRGGVCLLYTHLGKVLRRDQPLPPRACAALQRLGQYFRNGKILVTTTRRLLNYLRVLRRLRTRIAQDSPELRIDLFATPETCGPDAPLFRNDLDGITLYVPEARPAQLMLNGTALSDVQRNAPDHTGQASLSLPWIPLSFPD
ncbi:MAG TPA: hypothetical protein VGM03_22885 [Phycisphaerae bacterium]|jgi:hypothetical protein